MLPDSMANDVEAIEVLLVDDNEPEIASMLAALRNLNMGVQLHVTRTCQEALAYLHSACKEPKAQRPRLILIEADHAGCHGFDVLDDVQTDHDLASIPVVLLTEEDHGFLPAYYAGRCQFVSKPLSQARLQQILDEFLPPTADA